MGSSMCFLSKFLIASVLSVFAFAPVGFSAAGEPLVDQDEQGVTTVSITTITRAETDVQIRFLRNIIYSDASADDAVFDELEKLHKILSDSRE